MSEILNEDEQKILLEYVYSDRGLYLQVLSITRPDYFDEPLSRAVDFVAGYFDEYHNLPDFDLIKVKTGVNFTKRQVQQSEFDYAVKEYERHCQLAAVKLAFHDSIEAFDRGEIEGIRKRMDEALAVAIRRELGIDQFKNVGDRLRKMQSAIDSRSIGWHKIDVILENIRRSELVLVAAGTAAGKSITLANIGNNLAKDNLNVLILSLELSKELISKRLDSVITGMEARSIFDNIEDVVMGLDAVHERYGSLIIDKLPNGSTAHDIRNYIIQYHLIKGHCPDVLILDYLDLMRPIEARSKEGAFDRDKAITEELRDVVCEFNMFGFTASQLNREAVGLDKVTEAHIAGGISKLNTVDAAIAILVPSEEALDNGERIFQQMKIRNGERHPAPAKMYLNPKNLRLTEEPSSVVGPSGIGPQILKHGNKGNKEGVRDGLSSVKVS